jgi:hypothetical protein
MFVAVVGMVSIKIEMAMMSITLITKSVMSLSRDHCESEREREMRSFVFKRMKLPGIEEFTK